MIVLGSREFKVEGSTVQQVRDDNGRLIFHPGSNKNTRRRDFAPRAIMIHWVGSENVPVRSVDPKAKWSVVDTLQERQLSYDFMIDSALRAGRRGIYQLADPVNTRTAHAGIANFQAFAISCVSRGFAAKEDMRGSDLLDRTELDWSEPRDVYRASIHRETTHLVSMHPDALHDLLWLVETLCGLMNIPRRIPWQSFTTREAAEAEREAGVIRAVALEHAGLWWLPLFDRDTDRWGRASEFEGVLGHFHTHKDKWDPGTQPFEALWREGFNPTGKPIR